MPKIKEIRKLGKEVKEIKPKKIEDLEEEIEENEEEQFNSFISGRVSRGTSTLAQSEIIERAPRERRISKEDESEVNFRPSYTGSGGNPYKSKNYTPVGSAESSSSGAVNSGAGSFRERSLEQRGNINQVQNQSADNQERGTGNMESGAEKTYAGQQEQGQNERKRRNDF